MRDIYPRNNDSLWKLLGVPGSRHPQNFLLGPTDAKNRSRTISVIPGLRLITHIMKHTVAGEGPISLPAW